MADHYGLQTHSREISAPEDKLLFFRAPFTGTITKVKIVVATASASGDADFELHIDGSEALGGPVQLLESSFEAEATGLTEAVTEGQTVEVKLTACPSPIGDDLTVWVVISDT